MNTPNVVQDPQQTDPNRKKTKSPYQPLKRTHDALMRTYAPLPEGVKRAGTEEQPVGVEFPEQTTSVRPWDRFKVRRVELVLRASQKKLAVEVAGYTTDIPEGSKSERLLLVCKISDSLIKRLKFADPVGEDQVKSEQTRMHQFILLREEGEGFVAKISRQFLKRYLEQE